MASTVGFPRESRISRAYVRLNTGHWADLLWVVLAVEDAGVPFAGRGEGLLDSVSGGVGEDDWIGEAVTRGGTPTSPAR